MQLLNKLKKKPFANDFHFFLISVILLFLSLRYNFFFLVLLLYIVYILRRTKLIVPIFVVLSMLVIRVILLNTATPPNQERYECKVYDITSSGVILTYKNKRIMVHSTSLDVKAGDEIICELEFIDSYPKSYETDFDYQLYLKSKGIFYQAKLKSYTVESSGFSFHRIKQELLGYYKLKLSEESYTYVSTVVFASNELEDGLKDGYSILGISHILAISGLHIMLLFKLISFLCLKLFSYYKDKIPILILLIYALFIGFPPSCARAIFFLILSSINKRGSIQYTKLDILSISFIFMIAITPYQIYNIGFILSYMVSFLFIFMNEWVSNTTSVKKRYITYYIIYFTTLPFVVNMTHQISILSLLISPILSVMVSFVVIPLSYILTMLPMLDFILQYIFSGLNMLVLALKDISITIPISSFSIGRSSIYYGLILFGLVSLSTKRKILFSITSFFLYLLLILQIHVLTPYHTVTFVDVGQGDCSVIQLAHNRGIMVIDAYNCIDYLKSLGIRKIDALVLTHSDMDHIKDAIEILEYFDVKSIFYPKYDDGFTEYDGMKIDHTKDIMFSGMHVEVLGPIYEHKDKNSNSIVLRLKLEGYSFLFCGDMTLEEEADLLECSQSKLSADVLKVGHHGSSTSSGEVFLEAVSPKYSIVSVGRDNSYGLPDSSVVDRLERISNVIQTKDSGNITFYINKRNMSYKTYR